MGVAALFKLAVLVPSFMAIRDPRILRLPMSQWLGPLPSELIPAVIGAWGVAGFVFLFGWHTRTAGGVLSLAMLMTLLGDQQLYSNHLYLALTLTVLLTVADAGAAISLDARRSGTRAEVPLWPVTLLKLQVTIVYGFAALAKLNLVYVSGAVLNAQLGWGSILPFPDGLRRWEVMSVLALLSILTEAFLAVALWSPRLRSVGFGLGLAFHIAIVLGMDPAAELIVFSLLMFSLYLLHLDAPVDSRLVIWDDSCSFCGSTVRCLRRWDWLRVHRVVGASTLEELPAGVSRADTIEALQLVTPQGRAAGFEAVRTILEVLPISFLWAPWLGGRVIRRVGARAYAAVAIRRRCRIVDRAS